MVDAANRNPRDYLKPQLLATISSLDLRARLIVEGLTAGIHRSPYHGISVEFAQHRQYTPGDDIRHVDWKVLAKTDKIFLKEYLEETNLQLICVVDASESMAYGTVTPDADAKIKTRVSRRLRSALFNADPTVERWTKYDHATAIAAALSYLVLQQQDSVGLAVFDQTLSRFLKPSGAPGQWQAITRELQKTPRLNKTSTGKILSQLAEKLAHRSVVVIISDFFDDLPDIRKGLQHLCHRRHEVLAMQVLDPAELDFPFTDMTRFEGMEEAGELLSDPASLRPAYLERLGNMTQQLQKMCRGMRIDFAQMSSAQPLDVSLSRFLQTRSARSAR
jgi:uncharacterized protein (DUF58 family)